MSLQLASSVPPAYRHIIHLSWKWPKIRASAHGARRERCTAIITLLHIHERERSVWNVSVSPHCLVLSSANSNWTGTGSLSEGEDGSKPGLWSKGPVVEFYHPDAVSAQSLTRAGWPIFSYLGVIKNVLRLIYTRLLRHDIIIAMHYNSRLLWFWCVLEQAILRWWKPIRVFVIPNTGLSQPKEKAQLSSVHYVILFTPLEMWPETSLHIIRVPVRWQFCSDSSVCGGTPGGEVCIPAVH